MNYNPNATVILCYGDSNTRGSTPTGDRYPADKRWTGILQSKLGDNYYIIEEGLGGRTTALDDVPESPGKNGKSYLIPCLGTHNPIDVVVLMLGTNDLKEVFKQSPEDIARNIKDLVKVIQEYGTNKNNNFPQIILLAPPYVDEWIASTQINYKGAEVKSKKLALLYQDIAKEVGCMFIDIAEIARPSSEDGLHLDTNAHQLIAEAVYKQIKQ